MIANFSIELNINWHGWTRKCVAASFYEYFSHFNGFILVLLAILLVVMF